MIVIFRKMSQLGSEKERNGLGERACKVTYLIRMARLMILGIVMGSIASCSKQVEYEIVTQQSHFPLKNRIVIRQIIQSLDQKFIATVGKDNGVRIWDFQTHTLVRAFNDIKTPIHAVHFLDSNKLVIITETLTILIYDLSTGKLVFKPLKLDYQAKPLTIRPSHIKGRVLRRRYFKTDPLKVKFSRTGRFVAVYTPSYLKVLDLSTFKVIKEFDKNKVRISLFDFTWPGENIVYATRFRKLEYFSFKTMSVYKQSKVMRVLRHSRIRDFSLIYNNTYIIASGWGRRQLKIWNLSNHQSARARYGRYRVPGYYNYRKLKRFFEPGKMYIDKSNSKLVLFRNSGEVMILDFKNDQKFTRLKFKNTTLHSVVTSGDGNKLLMASQKFSGGGYPYLVVDSKTGKINFAQENVLTYATAFLVQAKNNVLYTVHFNGSIHKWQLNTGRHIETYRVGIEGINRLYMLKDRQTLMGLATERKLFSYDMSKKKLTRLIYLNSQSLKSIGLDLTSNRFLTGYGGSCFKSWSLRTWTRIGDDESLCSREVKKSNGKIQNIIYNKSTKSTIFTYDDVNVKIYSDLGKTIASLLLKGKIKQISLSHSGKTLAVTIEPKYLYIWKLSSLTIVQKITLPSGFTNINSLSYSNNDQFIYVGTADGTLSKYNVKSGQIIYQQERIGGPISILTEDAGSQYVISGHVDNTIQVRNSKNGKLNYIIEVLPDDQWIIYRPGMLPLVASPTAKKYFKLRGKSSLRFYPDILKQKSTYTNQLPGLKSLLKPGEK